MPDQKSEARVTQRCESYTSLSKLKIAVVRKKLLNPSSPEYCDLLNISQGGIGITSQWLDAKIGQKFDLELHYGHKKYVARGLVVRISTQGEFDYYGIAFIYAPPELDLLIQLFVHPQPTVPMMAPSNLESEKEHRWDKRMRIDLQDAQVYVKKSEGVGPFLLCQVDNISKSGIGFYCDRKLDKAVPFAITVRLSMPPEAIEISGTVHYISKKLNTYYYGMEYEPVSKKLLQLLSKLG